MIFLLVGENCPKTQFFKFELSSMIFVNKNLIHINSDISSAKKTSFPLFWYMTTPTANNKLLTNITKTVNFGRPLPRLMVHDELYAHHPYKSILNLGEKISPDKHFKTLFY